MRYLIGIGGVLLLQAAISYAIILAGTGNGSFVGLGAMLFAVVGIPVTAIVNLMLIHTHRKNPAVSYIRRMILFALALERLQSKAQTLVEVTHLSRILGQQSGQFFPCLQ